jgi:outer membrane protein OmpA-like peptidoglycan-associated protein
VATYSGEASPPSINGSWGEGDAITLSVTLNNKTAALGRDDALTADGKGNWTLALNETLPPGSYDVLVMTADRHGRIASDATENEVVVKASKTEPVLPAPTVDPQEALVDRPTVTGTWPEDMAANLSVSLAGQTFTIGQNGELTSNAGRWSLAFPASLNDGVYDVAVEVTGKNGAKKQDESQNELIIDAVGPADPTVTLYSGTQSPSTITGTWAEGDAVSLKVSLNGTMAELGKDAGLKSDGQGNWSLTLTNTLAPGSYDVAVVTADKHGRIASDQTRSEILVKDNGEPPPPPPPPPDCDTEFMKTLITRPIHFETDKSAVTTEAAAIIKDLAVIAGYCKDKRLEVGGHTDWIGSEAYNQALSERRAVAVVNALVSLGVDRGRLEAKGYGESMPLANNETPEGRFVNRRIEIKTIK